jgi:hypothetical protein
VRVQPPELEQVAVQLEPHSAMHVCELEQSTVHELPQKLEQAALLLQVSEQSLVQACWHDWLELQLHPPSVQVQPPPSLSQIGGPE